MPIVPGSASANPVERRGDANNPGDYKMLLNTRNYNYDEMEKAGVRRKQTSSETETDILSDRKKNG